MLKLNSFTVRHRYFKLQFPTTKLVNSMCWCCCSDSSNKIQFSTALPHSNRFGHFGGLLRILALKQRSVVHQITPSLERKIKNVRSLRHSDYSPICFVLCVSAELWSVLRTVRYVRSRLR